MNMKNIRVFPLLLFILLLRVHSFSQLIVNPTKDSIPALGSKPRTNPILYGEIFFGAAGGDGGGLSIGAELNYQFHRSIFSLRVVGNAQLDLTISNPIVPLPMIRQGNTLGESAFLYGWRFIGKSLAINISTGISQNSFDYYEYTQNEDNSYSKKISTDTYWGIPWEATFHIFKGHKKRIRLLFGFLPVGKPTALGLSIGLKLYGNISKNSYTGFGLTYGLGYHKHY